MGKTQDLQKSQGVFEARLRERETAKMNFFRGGLASAGSLFLAQEAIVSGTIKPNATPKKAARNSHNERQGEEFTNSKRSLQQHFPPPKAIPTTTKQSDTTLDFSALSGLGSAFAVVERTDRVCACFGKGKIRMFRLQRMAWCGFFGLWMGAMLWACTQDVPCKADSECAQNQYCDTSRSKCRPNCSADPDCLAGETCNQERKRCQGSATENVTSDGGNPDGIGPDGGKPDGIGPDGETPEGTETPTENNPTENNPEQTTGDSSIPGKSPNCPVETRECYSGAAGTQGKGACKAGKQRCVDGNWGPCVGEVVPKTEQCNGIDDDCDGQVDGNCTTWATSLGGKGGDEGANIAVSPSGQHIYVTGSFAENAALGAKSLVSKGDSDAYLARLDAKGQVMWATALGGSGEDRGKAVATDETGNLYATGLFEGSINVGAVTLNSKGGKNIYVVKMDDTGRVLWTATAGSATGSVEPHAIFGDKAGNVYIAGSFGETASFGSVTLTAKGYLDVFVAKLDPSGQFVWATSAGGTDSEEALGVAADETGNVYITGYFQGNASFGSSALSSVGTTNAFVSKLNNAGQFQWTTTSSQSWYAAGRGIQLDKNGNVYATGYFEQQAAFGLNAIRSDYGTDTFVAKISPTGTFVWSNSTSGYANNPGKGIGIDSTGNLYITGSFGGPLALGSTNLNSQTQDIYIAKIGTDGKFLSGKALSGREVKSSDHIATDTNGSVYIIGTYRGSMSANSTTLTSKGYTDTFVAKITF